MEGTCYSLLTVGQLEGNSAFEICLGSRQSPFYSICLNNKNAETVKFLEI